MVSLNVKLTYLMLLCKYGFFSVGFKAFLTIFSLSTQQIDVKLVAIKNELNSGINFYSQNLHLSGSTFV